MRFQFFSFSKFNSRRTILNWIINLTGLLLLIIWSFWPIGGFFLAANWGLSFFGYEFGKKRPAWIEQLPNDVYSLLWVIYWVVSNTLILLLISLLPRVKRKLCPRDNEDDRKVLLSDLHLSKTESEMKAA